MALLYRYSTFESTVMPPGLTNAPATFLNLINSIFAKFFDELLTVFLDDLLVYSASELEQLAYLQNVYKYLYFN